MTTVRCVLLVMDSSCVGRPRVAARKRDLDRG